MRKTRCYRFQVNNSLDIEDIICIVNEWIGAKGMVFQAWTHELVP